MVMSKKERDQFKAIADKGHDLIKELKSGRKQVAEKIVAETDELVDELMKDPDTVWIEMGPEDVRAFVHMCQAQGIPVPEVAWEALRTGSSLPIPFPAKKS
jgi:hypothetical protein